MVRIKEEYVMSAAENAEYERQDALPRKTYGKVDYYKPPTKYPARIYVFMQAELWCDRNRRPMGLYQALPFLSREINREELEYHHFNWGLCYHQYERWDKLLSAEAKEAEQLDREMPGSGTEFLRRLAEFRGKYLLSDGFAVRKAAETSDNSPPPPIVSLDEQPEKIIEMLINSGHLLPSTEIGRLLGLEQAGGKRREVIIALRFLYRQSAGEINPGKRLDLVTIRRKAAAADLTSRRNFVRRIYHQNPLFALLEIQNRYPGYSESLLRQDLRRKGNSKKGKIKRGKPITDLRRCQLIKLAAILRNGNLPDNEYDQTCHRIALTEQAHRGRLPIRIAVNVAGQKRSYDFPWRSRENVVKSFVAMANTAGITHEQLAARFREILSSNYSF
ncbi:hypothetical protein ACRQ5D_34395 [Mucilaginibacter sp. P25]|uniref:hypothetical protein n=1 Tax=Mucilaginibacter sp. P25 TaxID=3423945 RepID=UPI003D79FF5E